MDNLQQRGRELFIFLTLLCIFILFLNIFHFFGKQFAVFIDKCGFREYNGNKAKIWEIVSDVSLRRELSAGVRQQADSENTPSSRARNLKGFRSHRYLTRTDRFDEDLHSGSN
jgi:hypothetical protein